MENKLKNAILSNLLVAVVYAFISGVTYLALAMEHALTPYWLATGFAVFVLTFRGIQLVPGIALGIILTKLITMQSGFGQIEHGEVWWVFPSLLVIKLIQTWSAAEIARWCFRRNAVIGRFGEVVKFFATVAIGPSMIASTFGVLLYISILHDIAPNLFIFWLSWTFGDLFGILSFLPLAIIIKQSSVGQSLRDGLRYGPPLLITVCLSLIFYTVLQNMERKKYESQFHSAAERFSRLFEGDFNRQLDSLSMLANVVTYYGMPDAKTFYSLADNVFTLKKGLQAVNFSKLISDDEKANLIKQIQNLGFPDFEIFNVGENGEVMALEEADFYLPLVYVFPDEKNKSAQGMNLLGRKGLEDLLQRVIDEKVTLATHPVRLVQDVGDSSWGVAIYSPVENFFFGEKQLIVLNFVFLFDELFQQSLELLEDPTLSAHLVDVTDPLEPQFLAASKNYNGKTEHHHFGQNGLLSSFDFETEIIFLNRKWHLHVEAPYGYPGILARLGSISVLGISFLFISLLGGYQITLFHQGHLVEKEVRRRTEELRIAKEEAEEASRVKNEFLAMTNHELRTPLNGIIATSEMLLDGDLDKVQRNLAGMIQSSGKILLDLINDVLDFARMEAGKLQLHETAFSPQMMIEQWQAVFMIAAKKKGLELDFVKSGLGEVELLGDVRRVNQIMINFLGNAVKFTEKGKISVCVELEKISEATYQFSFEVEDTGEGISEKKLGRLFEAFEQEDEAITRRYEGTGLGLAICKQLCDAMNGQIFVESEKGVGTKIKFVAAFRAASQDEVLLAQPTPQPSIGQEKLQSANILVVEDNPVNQKVMELLLERLKHKITIAEDGHTALKSLLQGPFDLILLDIHLPDMDGLKVASEIRKSELAWCGAVPIIALTANTTEEMRKRCHEAGMQDFIAKPIQINHLKKVLRNWLT